jgi:hypothetical protein
MNVDEAGVPVLVLWVAVLAVLCGVAWKGRRPVVGLTVAYWWQLWLFHGLGGLVHALSWYEGPNHSAALVGFHITGYAMAGLLAGNLIALLLTPAQHQPAAGKLLSGPGRLPALYIVSGLALYGLLGQLLAGTDPDFGALASGGFHLAIAGFCLWWFLAWKAGKTRQAHLTPLLALVLLFLTASLAGFLADGVLACVAVACFVGTFYRPRWAFVGAAGVALLLALLLSPAYLGVREENRGGGGDGQGFGARLGRTALLAREGWWFDVGNRKQLGALDERLNRNIRLGWADRYMSEGNAKFARGETLWSALLAPVPRALWPDKPEYAGSGTLVTRFTGVRFADGTRIGIGHVMELFVNFGIPGVLVGYVLLGTLLGLLDTRCAGHLLAGNWGRFTLLYVIGLSLLQVSGCFAEAACSAAGGAVLCLLVAASSVSSRAGSIGFSATLGGPVPVPKDISNDPTSARLVPEGARSHRIFSGVLWKIFRRE